jgi:hypothetical protein
MVLSRQVAFCGAERETQYGLIDYTTLAKRPRAASRFPFRYLSMSTGDLDSLISKVETARKSASGNAQPEVATGELLWKEIAGAHENIEGQEVEIVKCANLITNAVKGFSDYSDCFYDASYLLQLGIERLSQKGALRCAVTCGVLYGTENSSTDFKADWANAALSRCAEWFAVVDVNDSAVAARLKGALNLVNEVAKAGQEYRDLIAQHGPFRTAVQSSLAVLEDALAQVALGAQTETKLNPLLKTLRTAAALCDNSPDGVILNLEQAVDLSKPDCNLLLEAYNAMCDEKPEDLTRQQRAAAGPLLQLAMHGLSTQTEGSKKYKDFLMESLMFCRLLLEPWARDDPAHMEAKRTLAEVLRSQGLAQGLLRQLAFWETEWAGSFGDCGDPCFITLLELVRYFPEVLTNDVAANEHAVALIRKVANNFRQFPTNRFGRETAMSTAARLEALLDGKTEEEGVPAGSTSTPGAAGFGFSF